DSSPGTPTGSSSWFTTATRATPAATPARPASTSASRSSTTDRTAWGPAHAGPQALISCAAVIEVALETERLVLRMPRLSDAVSFATLFNDPTAMEFIGGVHPETSDDPEFPIRRWLERWEANGVGPLIAERREDGVVVGRAGLHIWDTSTWTPASYASAGEHA